MAQKNEIFNEISQLNEKLYILIKKIQSSEREENDFIEEINELYRIFHTLKSLTLMAGLNHLSDIIHLSEQIFSEIKKGKIELQDDTIGLIYDTHSFITKTLNGKKISRKEKKEITEKINLILSKKENIENADLKKYIDKLPQDLAETFTETEINRIYKNVKKGSNIYLCKLSFNFETFEKDIESITEQLVNYGEVIATIPGELKSNNTEIEFSLLYATSLEKKEIKILCGEKTEISLLIKGEKKQKTIKTKSEKVNISPVLKIESSLIDSLLGDIDELENAKSELIKKTREVTEGFQFEKLEFHISVLNKKITDLHKNIVNLRLVTLWPLFQIIENTIKTTATELNKKVKVEIKGANAKIDKPIIDILIDPLIHLARNALDHGIESPEERIKKGKPEEGKILINAYQSENSVYIEFSDDGKGIDLEDVKKKAEQLGLTKLYHNITEEQLLQFLFQPGFSTKEHLSKISGRGIGLDSVKATLTSIGGDIFIETEKGKGTKFTLKLPITTAIMPLFFATVDEFIICIPEFAINSIEEFNKNKLTYLNNKTFYRIDDNPVPLINLPQLLNKTTVFSSFLNIIALNFANTSICVLVDKIIDHQEKTIIPFKGKLKRFPLFSGVCRYEDNKIGFVLDVNQLIELTRKKYETKLKFTTFNF